MPEVSAFLIRYWPELIPLVIFLYGLVAVLTTTTLLGASIVRITSRLRNVRTREQLLGAFAQSRLEPLLARILDLAPSDVSGESIVIQSPFRAGRARRQIAQVYRGKLATFHFFTALAALLVIAALSWMQDEEAEGLIFVGPPGTAKSATAKAAGNSIGIPTIAFDFGAMMYKRSFMMSKYRAERVTVQKL